MGEVIREFTVPEAARLARVEFRNLNYWITSGMVKPSVAKSAGRGKPRLLSHADVRGVRVIGEFRKQGVSLQGLRRVAAWLRDHENIENIAGCRLVATRGPKPDVVLARSDLELVSALRRQGEHVFAFVLDLEYVLRDVEERISQFKRTDRRRGKRKVAA